MCVTRNVQVVEDGAETVSSSRTPQGPSWFWVVVGLVIGLGLAVVFFTAGSDEPVEATETVPTPDLDQPAEPQSEPPSRPQRRSRMGLRTPYPAFPTL